MLLDRIDIDVHGPLNRVELGPFSEQLNVVCGPDGSGKTAIARFVRDSLVDRQYPLGMMSSSTGRIVWADRHGIVHCRREKDGTASGRTSVEFQPRGDRCLHWDALRHSWVDVADKTSPAGQTLASIALPEPMVDGVITDCTITNIARIVAACVASGLDRPLGSFEHDKPADYLSENNPGGGAVTRATLRTQLAEVETQIAQLESRSIEFRGLLQRRETLCNRLAETDQASPAQPRRSRDQRSAEERRLTELYETVRELRKRQSVIRRSFTAAYHEQGSEHRPLWSYTTTPDSAEADRRQHLESNAQRIEELDRIACRIDKLLDEAARIRRNLSHWNARSTAVDSQPWVDRDAIEAELRSIDAQLANRSRLQARRDHLIAQLSVVAKSTETHSSLQLAASTWLVRLSAGRLRRIQWQVSDPATTATQAPSRSAAVSVQIDGCADRSCSATDRALAVLAVRLAAGDRLAASGRAVPLLIEAHRELLSAPLGTDPDVRHALAPSSTFRTSQNPVALAICDYARSGRQVIVLTSHEGLTARIDRAGGRVFRIHAHKIVHAHRPIWRSHYAAERYDGPHPHTYGDSVAVPRQSSGRSVAEINRDLDVAWHEAIEPDRGHAASTTDLGPTVFANAAPRPYPTSEYRDGHYSLDSYTTQLATPDRTNAVGAVAKLPAPASPPSPFYLTVDSPIDQAPSIDAVAAARLRGLQVTHINHLMQQDSNRLSDALGMASVDAATIRRWQAECRLACQVPHLRGFDARVLVGCGVADPAELAATHPGELLDRVEAFLATQRGRQVLLSGTSRELARITSWIATANSTPAERAAIAEPDELAPVSQSHTSSGRRVRSGRHRTTNRPRHADSPSRRRHRKNSPRTARRDVSAVVADKNLVSFQSGHPPAAEETQRTTELRFYLHRGDAVVDAPSIGPRMAERLEATGIETVGDLLNADPDSVATQLDHRRIDGDAVLQWQQQAELVCRVPLLRGHDAQLLVLAEVTSPEALAACDADELFALIDPISHSKQGQRVLRGGNPPDLAEVSQWIQCAQHTRELRAA